jgi:hypothetical protein
MPNSLRTIFFIGAVALSAGSTAGTPAGAQSFFCPTTIAGLTGIHFAVNECTNGNTGAYSNATLAAQAVSDLSQSSTQDATKATMTGLSNRRAAEQNRCPEGYSRIGGVCQRDTIQAMPFAAESPLRGALLPAELQAAAPRLQVSAAERMPVATWVELHGDYELRTGRGQGSGEFGRLALDARSTTRSGGLVGGVDVTLRNIASPGDGFIIGLLTGYMSSNLTVNTKSTSADPARIPGGSNTLNVGFTGPSAGIYASYFNGPFSSDLAFKADFLDLDLSFSELLGFRANPALGIAAAVAPFSGNGSTGLTNYTFGGNVNYRLPINASVWLQPTAGFQYTRSDYAADAAQFALDDGYLLRLQGGVRAGMDGVWGGTPVTTSFTALIYDNVRVRGGFVPSLAGNNPLILNDEGKLRGQAGVAVNFQHANGVSSFLQGEVRGGQDLIAAGGRAGLRIAW